MENELKPRIRFKGFTEAWEQRKLGDLGDFKSNGVNKLSKPDEIPVNLLNYMDVYKRRELNNKMTFELMQVTAKPNQLTDNNVLKGDVFFTPTSETADDIGHCMAIKETLNNTVYSYHLIRYRPYQGSFYLTYPNYAFETIKVRNKMSLMAQGVQRFVLSKSQFESIEISYTVLGEQKKIADFLTNIDNLITLHQRKYEKLQCVKMGLLKKMFPAEDKDKPEIRFNGFTEAWEQRKLIELGKIETGNTPSTSISKYYCEEGLPWITPTDIISNLTTKTERTLSAEGAKVARVIPANSVLCTCIASIGKNTFSPVKCAFNQQINALTPNNNQDPYFMHTDSYHWSETMKKGAGGLTFQIVNKTEFSNILTNVPCKEEQVKIGELFKNLDNLITLHQRKCEKLKNIKKALLEKMFC